MIKKFGVDTNLTKTCGNSKKSKVDLKSYDRNTYHKQLDKTMVDISNIEKYSKEWAEEFRELFPYKDYMYKNIKKQLIKTQQLYELLDKADFKELKDPDINLKNRIYQISKAVYIANLISEIENRSNDFIPILEGDLEVLASLRGALNFIQKMFGVKSLTHLFPQGKETISNWRKNDYLSFGSLLKIKKHLEDKHKKENEKKINTAILLLYNFTFEERRTIVDIPDSDFLKEAAYLFLSGYIYFSKEIHTYRKFREEPSIW